MKTWLNFPYIFTSNLNWLERLYEEFLTDPNSVDVNWRLIFHQLSSTGIKSHHFCSKKYGYLHSLVKDRLRYSSIVSNYETNKKQFRVLQLINAYRFYGHHIANIDPLGLWKRDPVKDLDPKCYNLTESDFYETFKVGSFAIGKKTMRLIDLVNALKQIYCSSIGMEYMYINSTEEKQWIQKRVESAINHTIFSTEEKKRFLRELTAAEGFERYLSIKFPGAKRFSLEGGDVLIPMLKELIRYAGSSGIREVVLGMAHRGRLNVLINVLGKKPQDLFDEFSGKCRIQYSISGDVKYHMGFSSKIKTEGGLVHLKLAFNPSHLEIITPVIIGSVRARLDKPEKSNDNTILPIIIHGDAAVAGQGVVQETLNMSKTRGYEVGGTIHIVINNQVGFTTSNQLDARSTLYCTDIGKIVQAPIFHVNADDPEAVVFVIRLALDYRNNFKRDVFVDLFCYRRHGHHEADEPSATQPLMYKKIKKHPTSRKIYADKLTAEKVISSEDATKMVNLYYDALDSGGCVVKEIHQVNNNPFACLPYFNQKCSKSHLHKIKIKHLKKLAKRISTIPDDIKMQTQVAKIYVNRRSMAAGKKLFDWGSAENLAYASLVDEGISVRLSGEDASRGTFFQRHAIVHNQIDGSTYIPLQHVHNKQGQFKVWDSVLSEEAVLAFEYGYSVTDPCTLTIWESQFGDFANGAQVVIDQFISSGKQKWGFMCGLVMFLPHGYEGQGPEHSSARLERYLQLCAEHNMCVCVPSTPAQVYHILRRQARQYIRRPLIVMSPKSLLRHQLAVSSLNELANGCFLKAIGEIDQIDPQSVKRVVFCSGKVYYDLLDWRRKTNQNHVALIRVEQLYPFPYQALQDILKPYTHVNDFVWCQEEPLNQGAWMYNQLHFYGLIPCGSVLRYSGRRASASTAVGCMFVHQKQQQDLVNDALNIN